ncbi:MAG: transmembrane transport protein [Actinomycetota bacterium]
MTLTVDDINHLLDAELRPARAAAIATLGGVGLAEAVLLTTLVATEPDPLPTDTTVALLALAVGGLAWALFAGWRLRNRQILLLHERVTAAAIATAITVLATIGAIAIAVARERPLVAAGIATAGGAVAIGAALQVRRRRADLTRARRRLAQLESDDGLFGSDRLADPA